MHSSDPSIPAEPAAVPDPAGLHPAVPDPAVPAAGLSWRLNPVLPVSKLVGAVALACLTYAFGRYDPVQWALAGFVALGLTGWALRDIVAPVRLSASPDGITVLTGIIGRRLLPWSAIERIRVDQRERRGLRSELLEIDAGDSLHLFSIHDLGTPPEEVAESLATLRPPR